MSQSDYFSEATIEELSQGYKEQEESYFCLLCGHMFEEGVIYPHGERLLSASRAVKEHLTSEHENVLDFLLGLNKKHTGLSENQSQILQFLGQGKDDADISATLGIATSTVRNYRFRLKEKARQSRIFLAMMSLVNDVNKVDTFVAPHRSAKMIDERYAVTPKQQEKIQRNYFTSEGRLKQFPAKEKKKLVILRTISERFETEREYSEKDVNTVLSEVFEDYVTLRRYLIQYGFLEREKNGSVYWKV